jgi:hypothetical protein
MNLGKLSRNIYTHLAAVALLGLIVYSNTFDVPFLFDDIRNIETNPLIMDLGYFLEPSKAERLPVSSNVYFGWKTRYIGYLTFALNFKMHGLDVTGYHVVNLAIHILTALAVYFLLVLTFKTPAIKRSPLTEKSGHIALFTALLFVCHPLQTQAVTYIVQRFASLVTMFYLLSLVLYIKARRNGSAERRKKKYPITLLLYCFSVLSCVLAMLTKQNAFTLPFAIALYELMFLRGGIMKRALLLVPFFTVQTISILSVGTGAYNCFFETTAVSWAEYFFSQFRVIVTYLRLLVLPVNQNIDYDYPVYSSFFEPAVFMSFMLLFGIFCLGIYLLHRSRITDHGLRLVAFGIFWFFITLSVESSVIPIGSVIFEHRVYLPSAGFFLAGVVAVFFLFDVLGRRRPFIGRALTPTLVLIILVMSVAAYERNSVWGTELGLWRDAVGKSPRKDSVHYTLAIAYSNAGKRGQAIMHYREAIRLNPDNTSARFNLALVLLAQGKLAPARHELEVVLELNPRHRARSFLDYVEKRQAQRDFPGD